MPTTHVTRTRVAQLSGPILAVIVAAGSLLGGLSVITVSVALAPQPGTDVIPQHQIIWGPGVAAAVLAALALLTATLWLVRAIRGRLRSPWWFGILGLAAIAFTVVRLVSQLPQPDF